MKNEDVSHYVEICDHSQGDKLIDMQRELERKLHPYPDFFHKTSQQAIVLGLHKLSYHFVDGATYGSFHD